ncbi:MAG: ABC transporter ATP-binding protein [Actinomycetota bacterium]|nr:ABC transporter ATP-binding protein [Actinomycetota bacterium]
MKAASGCPGSALLDVRGLHVAFPTPAGVVRAVNDVSFTVRRGERVGIVGESGAGKSVVALAIMRLLPQPPAQVSGRILFDGTDLLSLGRKAMRRVRGARIAMVFQDPVTCLSPRLTVGDQIVEAIRAHRDVSPRGARDRALELLASVGIPEPGRWADQYPHRLSGGMAQRVMIAMAVSCDPDLIIADEPTTALDVTIEAQIIDLLVSLCESRGAAVVLITHDLALMARFADRVMVMYAGGVVERADVDTIYEGATHPYTWGLMQSLARPDQPRGRLSTIRGTPPSALALPSGCPFHPRCPYVEDICRREVPALTVRAEDDHDSACHFAGRLPRPQPLRQVRR